MIYLDHAATTPMSDEALEVYHSVAKRYFGNADSMHDYGSSAEQILKASRRTLAGLIGASEKDLHFTGGATDSTFLLLYTLLSASPKEGKHILISAAEHSSVNAVAARLQNAGYEITEIPLDEKGLITKEAFDRVVRPDTVLASVHMVNSETGVIQPVSEIADWCRSRDVLIHTDAVQAFGKIPVLAGTLNADAISISAHKIYGPKGCGAAWLNPALSWSPVFPGKNTGNTFRPGTADVPSAAAFAAAGKAMEKNREDEWSRISELRTRFIAGLRSRNIDFIVEGYGDKESEYQLPHILGLRFPGIEGQFFMLECSQAGIAISTGSACRVGSEQPSVTMKALGRDAQQAREFIRLSFGRLNTANQIDQIIEKMHSILNRHYQKINEPE